jgi:hypothetical protein
MGANNDTKHINDAMNNNVSEQTNVATKEEAAKKLKLDDQTAYIEADAFVANPYSLLGRVIQIRKINGACPNTLNDPDYKFEFTISPIPNIKIDEASKLKEPILRSSIIIDKQLSLNVSFLSYLSAQLDAKSFFSLMVFDQTTGLVDVHDNGWTNSVKQWKEENQDLITDPDVCYLFAVTGFVQKNIVRKKYIKFDASAKGGAYGVNINGELSTSTEEYSLDMRFGLTPGILKRPGKKNDFTKTLVVNPTIIESQLFGSLTGATATNLTIERKFRL